MTILLVEINVDSQWLAGYRRLTDRNNAFKNWKDILVEYIQGGIRGRGIAVWVNVIDDPITTTKGQEVKDD